VQKNSKNATLFGRTEHKGTGERSCHELRRGRRRRRNPESARSLLEQQNVSPFCCRRYPAIIIHIRDSSCNPKNMPPCIESSRPSPKSSCRRSRRTKQRSSLNAMLAADSGQDPELEVPTSTAVAKPNGAESIIKIKESFQSIVPDKEEHEFKPEDTRALARNLRRAKRALLLKSAEEQQPPALSLLRTRLLSMSLKQRNTSTSDFSSQLANPQAVCIFRAPSRSSSEESIYY